MKIKKILVVAIIFLFAFIFSACSKETEIKRIYYLQNAYDNSRYDILCEKKSKVKKTSFDFNKIFKQDFEDGIAGQYEVNQKKTTLHKQIANMYLDLKEFQVTLFLNGKEETIGKYKYLSTLDIEEEIKKRFPSFSDDIYDETTRQFLSGKVLVLDNHKLVVNNEPHFNSYKKLLKKTEIQMNGLIFDIELHDKSTYYKGSVVVKKDVYDRFTKALEDFVKSLKSNDKKQKNAMYAKLVIESDNLEKAEKRIGEKEYDDSAVNNLKVEYDKIFAELSNKYNKLKNDFASTLRLKNNTELDKEFTDVKFLSESIYDEIQQGVEKVAKDLVQKIFHKDNIKQTKENIDALKQDLKKIVELQNKNYENVKHGLSERPKKDYKIRIYENGELKETITKKGYENGLILYNPEQKPRFYIDENSILTGVNHKDSELVLEVYYKTENLIIKIDLDGGECPYSENYIEIGYGETIKTDIVEKIRKVTKKDDNYGKKYTFSKFVDAETNQEIDFSSAIIKSLTIKAQYTKEATAPFHYEILYFVDRIDSLNFNEPEYSAQPQEIVHSSETVNICDLVAFSRDDILPKFRSNGFIIDEEKSVLEFGKIGYNDKIKVYIKRKILRITLDTIYNGNEILIDDPRIQNNRLGIKFGTPFNIFPEKAYVEKGSKAYIFEKLVDTNKDQEFVLGQEVKENLSLKFILKEVDKNDVVRINFSRGFLGKRVLKIGDEIKEIEEYLYVEKGTKIKDPVFFKNTHDPMQAELELDNNIGFIKDKTDVSAVITKDTIFNNDKYELEFVYRMDIEKIDAFKNILFKEQNYLFARDKEFEIKGKIIAILEEGKQFFLETSKGNILIKVSGTLTASQLGKMKINNIVSISGTINKNYSDIPTPRADFKVGRYKDYVLEISNASRVNKIEDGINHEPIVYNLEKLSDGVSLTMISIEKLVIVDTMGKIATNVYEYDKNINIPKYYSYKVLDKFGNVAYLYLDENNNDDKKLFLDLSRGAVISIENAYFMDLRIQRKGIPAFNDGSTKSFAGIVITDFLRQVKYVENENITVGLNIEFETYENWVKHTNQSFKYEFQKNVNLKAVLNQHFEYNIYNGYKIKEIRINDRLVLPQNYDNTILENNDDITIYFDKAESYIVFYYGTYLPRESTPNFYMKAHKGGMEYKTYPVDYDKHFYMFILEYDLKDIYIEIELIYTKNFSRKVILNLGHKNEANIRKFAALDTCKYALIHNGDASFGTLERNSISYEWGDILPEEINGNNKGLFVHCFSLDGPSGNYAEEYADRSLYSAILLENENLATANSEKNINKDHNMLSYYTKYDGNRFYQIDGNLNEDEIRNSKKLKLKAFIKMYVKDINEQGNEYDTERIMSYYFHKSSITKYARFNKFGLGYVFADLTPYVNGKLLSAKSLQSSLSPQEQKDMVLATNDNRIIETFEAFLEHLKDNNTQVHDNIYKVLREYDNLKFKILDDNLLFKNGEKEFNVLKRYNQEITKEEFGFRNLGDKKVAFINLKNNEVIDFKYIYQNKEIKEYGIITYDEKNIEIYVVNDTNAQNQEIIPAFSNSYLLDKAKQQGEIEGFKRFILTVPYNKDFPQLYTYLLYNTHFLSSIDFNYTTKISFASESNRFIYFASSEKIIPINPGKKKAVIVIDYPKDEFGRVSSFVLKAETKTNEHIVKEIEGELFPQIGYFVLDYEDKTDYKKIEIYEKSYYPSPISRPIKLNNSDIFIRAFIKGKNNLYSIKNIQNKASEIFNYNKVIINPISLMYNENLDLTKKEILYQRNKKESKIILTSDMFKEYFKSGYEVIFKYLKDGVEIDYKIDDEIITNQDIIINVYYRKKYKPGSKIEITLDFGKLSSYSGEPIGYHEKLNSRTLLKQSIYVDKNEDLNFLKDVKINADWLGAKEFVGWQKDGIDFDYSNIFDGKNNILLVAKYQDKIDKKVVRIETYKELQESTYENFKTQQVVDNIVKFTYDKNNILIPNGYLLDENKSLLVLDNFNNLNENERIIKIYLKKKRFSLTFNFQNISSLTLEQTNLLTTAGFIKVDNQYKKDVLFETNYYEEIKDFLIKYNLESFTLKTNVSEENIKFNLIRVDDAIVYSDILISFTA